jgi:hypothetical protein
MHNINFDFQLAEIERRQQEYQAWVLQERLARLATQHQASLMARLGAHLRKHWSHWFTRSTAYTPSSSAAFAKQRKTKPAAARM